MNCFNIFVKTQLTKYMLIKFIGFLKNQILRFESSKFQKKLFNAIEDGLNQGICSGHLKNENSMCVCTCVCLCVCVPSTGTGPGKAETGPDSETQACLPNVWYTTGSQYTHSLNKQKNEWASEWIFGSPLYSIVDIAIAPSTAIYFPKFIHTHHSLQVVHPLHETATWTKTRRFSPSFSDSKLSVWGVGGGSCLGFYLAPLPLCALVSLFNSSSMRTHRAIASRYTTSSTIQLLFWLWALTSPGGKTQQAADSLFTVTGGPCGEVYILGQIVHLDLAAKSVQSYPTLCDPIDSSPSGSPVPGILQARILEWVAISFSNAWKWKVKVKSLSSGPGCSPLLSQAGAGRTVAIPRDSHSEGVGDPGSSSA